MLVFVVTPLVLILANAFIYDGKFSFKNFGSVSSNASAWIAIINAVSKETSVCSLMVVQLLPQ